MDGKDLGKEIADGIIIKLGFVYILAIVLAAIYSFFTPKDNTNPVYGRSGLSLYLDSLTGVQYVGNGNGLTVRVDRDGLPIFIKNDSTK